MTATIDDNVRAPVKRLPRILGDKKPLWLRQIHPSWHPTVLAERDSIARRVAAMHRTRLDEACDALDDILNAGHAQIIPGHRDKTPCARLKPSFLGEAVVQAYLRGRF